MEEFRFRPHMKLIQKMIKDLGLFCVICQIEGDRFIQKWHCYTFEEMNHYLSFNRGQYIVVFLEEVDDIVSHVPFENFCGLN